MELPDLIAWPRRADLPGMLFRRLISRHALAGLEGLSRAEQVLWLTFELVAEVSNGGLEQFFSNSSGDRAAFVGPALRELGFPALVEAFGRAAGLLPAGAERAERFAALRRLDASGLAVLKAAELELEAGAAAVNEALATWIVKRPGEFTLANAGLGAFRPVDIPAELPLDEVLADELPDDVVLPALFVRWAARPSLSAFERGLSEAIYAFGEISDEGAFSYFFCARGSEATTAREVLRSAGATDAARVLDKALALVDFSEDVGRRRAMLDGLGDDKRTALSALQWELDSLREPTLSALTKYARAHRAALT